MCWMDSLFVYKQFEPNVQLGKLFDIGEKKLCFKQHISNTHGFDDFNIFL